MVADFYSPIWLHITLVSYDLLCLNLRLYLCLSDSLLCIGRGAELRIKLFEIGDQSQPIQNRNCPPPPSHFLARMSSIKSLIHPELIPYPDVWCWNKSDSPVNVYAPSFVLKE